MPWYTMIDKNNPKSKDVREALEAKGFECRYESYNGNPTILEVNAKPSDMPVIDEVMAKTLPVIK